MVKERFNRIVAIGLGALAFIWGKLTEPIKIVTERAFDLLDFRWIASVKESIEFDKIVHELMLAFEDRWRSAKSFTVDKLTHTKFSGDAFDNLHSPKLQC